MEHVWLNRTRSGTCILFLTGWGMDEHPFCPLSPGENDILIVYDYRTLHPLPMDLLAPYEKIHLVAWSMGIWVAGHLLRDKASCFETCTAFSGTIDPVHETLGIPPRAYQELESNFSRDRLREFHHSMFTEQEELELFAANAPRRALTSVGEELTAFRRHYEEHGSAQDIFTHKIVTSRDRVFPLKNQRRSWGKSGSSTVKLPHFPFYSLKNWPSILELGQADTA